MNDQLCRLLDEQGQVVTSAQVLRLLSRRTLEAELKSGALQKLWYGIYARGDVDTRMQLHGLDLATGATVAVCLGTAAAVYGFDTEETVELHVLNPSGGHLRSTDGLVVHRRDDAQLTLVAGRPVTAPDWTAIEVARGLRRPRAQPRWTAALRSGFAAELICRKRFGNRQAVAASSLSARCFHWPRPKRSHPWKARRVWS